MQLLEARSSNQVPHNTRQNQESLASAFELFNQVSGELMQSYQALEERVRFLSAELERVNEQRLRELEDKERLASRLHKLLQLLPGGVVVLNGQGRVAVCNPAATALLEEPLEGERWLDIVNERFAPRQDDGHEVSLRNGKRVSLISRSLEGEPGQIILITDQTETRDLQHRLSRHQRLTEMGRMMSSLAHQIRTPLTAAMLYAGHISQHETSQQGRLAQTSDKLMSRLQNMERQVKDMLLFAKGETALEDDIALASLLQEIVESADVMLEKAGINLHRQISVVEGSLRCNKEALLGAALNLIENALQHGDENLTLTLCCDNHCEPGHVRLFVEDNGPGIDPALIAQVTEAFYTTRSQGTGLGLAVAQVVAKAHHGEFFIENCHLHENASGLRAGFVLPLESELAKGELS